MRCHTRHTTFILFSGFFVISAVVVIFSVVKNFCFHSTFLMSLPFIWRRKYYIVIICIQKAHIVCFVFSFTHILCFVAMKNFTFNKQQPAMAHSWQSHSIKFLINNRQSLCYLMFFEWFFHIFIFFQLWRQTLKFNSKFIYALYKYKLGQSYEPECGLGLSIVVTIHTFFFFFIVCFWFRLMNNPKKSDVDHFCHNK